MAFMEGLDSRMRTTIHDNAGSYRKMANALSVIPPAPARRGSAAFCREGPRVKIGTASAINRVHSAAKYVVARRVQFLNGVRPEGQCTIVSSPSLILLRLPEKGELQFKTFGAPFPLTG